MDAYVVLGMFPVVALFILALVALIHCRQEDLPKIVEALTWWWRR